MDQNLTGEDSVPITIQIVESQLKEKITSYLIRGEDKLGSFEANRRFNDFYNLRVALVQRWPGCYIPPIPSKQTIGYTEIKVIEDRKRFLQHFCDSIALLKYLAYSDEFQTFLRTKNSDIEKALNALPKQTIQDIFNKYKISFSHLNGQEINTEMIFKTTSFATYLTKSLKTLTLLKEQVKNLGSVKKQYTDQFTIMTQVLIPEYEKNILLEYADQNTDSLIFTNNNEVNLASRDIVNNKINNNEQRDITQQSNNFDLLVDMIRIEFREVEALQEAIAQKELYDGKRVSAVNKLKEQQSELSKLLAGKTTLKSFFSKGSSQDQVGGTEKKIQDVYQTIYVKSIVEIESLTMLCDVMVLLLGHDEIDLFKKKKSIKYLDILQKVSQLEMDLNNLYIKLWIEVAKCTGNDSESTQ